MPSRARASGFGERAIGAVDIRRQFARDETFHPISGLVEIIGDIVWPARALAVPAHQQKRTHLMGRNQVVGAALHVAFDETIAHFARLPCSR